MPVPLRPSRATSVLALLVVAGCSSGELLGPGAGGPRIDTLVRAISARGGVSVTATVSDSAPPRPGTGGVLQVTGIGAVINGGSAPVALSAPAAMQRVLLSVTGYSGHYAVTLPAGVQVADLTITLADSVPNRPLSLQWRAEIGGNISSVAVQSLRFIPVGSGDVQVSVAWSGASDVDLYATSPQGDQIFFGNPTGASGGTLDLDSNPGCAIDNVNNENIVWPPTRAPRGTYTVRLNYFSDCGVPRSDWVVTIQVRGQAPQVYSGSFVGPRSANPQVTVATFTY